MSSSDPHLDEMACEVVCGYGNLSLKHSLFDTLPNELLVSVFTWTLRLIEEEEPLEAVSDVPHLLSGVCRRWYQISTNIAELWTFIFLSQLRARQPIRTNDYVALRAQRSGALLLHFHVDVFVRRRLGARNAQPLADLFFRPYASRVGSLSLADPPLFPLNFITDTFPQLESVHLLGSSKLSAAIVWHLAFQAPHLRSFQCHGSLPMIESGVFGNLRELALDDFPYLFPTVLVRFLKQTACLERLSLKPFPPLQPLEQQQDDDSVVPIARLPFLKRIVLNGASVRDVGTLLKIIVAPELETLVSEDMKPTIPFRSLSNAALLERIPMPTLAALKCIHMTGHDRVHTTAFLQTIVCVAPNLCSVVLT